jgi:hypothetical protein
MAGMMKETGFRPGDFVSITGSKALQAGMDEWKETLKAVRGGVLFLDEAYQLHPRRGGGQTAQQMLDLLMEHLERSIADSTVILAGYEDEVRDLLGVNPGFASRFPTTFTFADYNEIQLRSIYRGMVKERGFTLVPKSACGVSVPRVVAARLARRVGIRGFGNAREVRNRVDEAVKRWRDRTGSALLGDGAAGGGASAHTSRTFFALSREDCLGAKPEFDNSPLLEALNAMIGLEGVKARARRAMTKVLDDVEREERGEPVTGMILHTVFMGNPGTSVRATVRVMILHAVFMGSPGASVSVRVRVMILHTPWSWVARVRA